MSSTEAELFPKFPKVEGNTLPSYDMVQNYGHLEEKNGIKPRFEEIIGKDFFKK